MGPEHVHAGRVSLAPEAASAASFPADLWLGSRSRTWSCSKRRGSPWTVASTLPLWSQPARRRSCGACGRARGNSTDGEGAYQAPKPKLATAWGGPVAALLGEEALNRDLKFTLLEKRHWLARLQRVLVLLDPLMGRRVGCSERGSGVPEKGA